ncbi:MAG TPA: TetR/AcrR family transcriptional regulator [Actinomycetota bacterium]|nr:TetR/AcrR family transcriptional regulator [Actinomycetota bacterium]
MGAEAPSARGERRRNRRGEGARLRADLIEAAARLLESSGDAEGLTLRAVAREVGIAAPSIYRHFSDKNELVEAVVADRFERLDAALVQAMAGAGDPAEALWACCGAYCRFGLEHPGHYQVLFSATLRLDPSARPQERPGQRVFGRLVAAVQACVEAGIARPGDAFAMAINVWVALHGIVSLRTSRPTSFKWPPVEALIDAALSGQVGLAATRPRTIKSAPAGEGQRRTPGEGLLSRQRPPGRLHRRPPG